MPIAEPYLKKRLMILNKGYLFFLFMIFLVGCQPLAPSFSNNTACDLYARRENKQSDMTLFVPADETLILEDAVECIGDPQLYRADISIGPHGTVKTVDLWYPTAGIVIIALEGPDTSIKSAPNEPHTLSIDRIFYIPPHTEPLDIADRIYRSTTADAQKERIQQLRPWLGWDKVEVIRSFEVAE